jgi:hypothetical protein
LKNNSIKLKPTNYLKAHSTFSKKVQHAPSPKPRQNPKILAPNGYTIS